jgi:hypothetical protein
MLMYHERALGAEDIVVFQAGLTDHTVRELLITVVAPAGINTS